MSIPPSNSNILDQTNLDENLQALNLNNFGSNIKKKSKRPMRAYHSDFNTPIISPSNQSPLIPQQSQFNNQIPQQSQFNQPQTYNEPQLQPQLQPQPQPQPPFAESMNIQDMNNLDSHSSNLSLQAFRYLNQKEYDTPNDQGQYKSFLTFSDTLPPDSTTQFHSLDQGSASSKFMRSTFYYVPVSEQLRSATKLPMAITIRPFAPLLQTEESVPLVDFNNSEELANQQPEDPLSIGPLRCHRCRAYVNSSMQFTHNQKFICNICQFSNNQVPNDYMSVLDSRGYRIDKFQRPELHKSVYDIKVPKEYNFGGGEKDSKPLHVVFLIDITENSIKQNLPNVVSDAIRATLFNNEELTGVKIALIAFDKRLHFFNLSSKLETTQISISSDLDDPFVPFDDGLFVDPEDSQFVIEDALNYIEHIGDDQIIDLEPCFTSACRTAGLCLESVGGGKIISILSNLPSWGPGGLKIKDNKSIGRNPTPEIEKKLLLPDNEYVKIMGRDFVEKSIGIDIHIVSHTPVDLSNLGWLASITGGELTRWPNFSLKRDGRFLTSKLINSYKNVTGYQGQLKLRCSNGLQVAQYYGTASSEAVNVQDPIIPILNKNQTFTILLQYDGKLSTKLDCHFQAALLYTDPNGVRKVRVINLVLAVTKSLEDVFHFTDENAIITTLIRDSLSFIGKQSTSELRESLNNKLVDIFTQYRAMYEYGHNKSKTLTNKLLFPDSLKHLPLYILSFLKTNAIKSNTTIDSRLSNLYNLLNMPVERLVYHLYPALIEVHSINEEGYINEETGFISLPQFKELSVKSLDHSVYILCNGYNVFIYIDPHSNILLLKDLFGEQIEDVKDIDPLIDELPELNTEISQQIRNIVKYFQFNIIGANCNCINIVRKDIDGSEIEFRENLRDDQLSTIMSQGPSYSEYLINLHKAIRNILDSDKASQSIKSSISNVEHDNSTLAQRYIHF
ncbi:unnamed protein product [Candida verbasci]|uniref:Uncharacterized protein n=1 Tax=Candida verbasci TaxID=1227364 RepID=A0A9W4TSF6_9ASCO|nr:unnamed protein product [Candida verbasci]